LWVSKPVNIATVTIKKREIYIYKVVDAKILELLPAFDEQDMLCDISEQLLEKESKALNLTPESELSEPTENNQKVINEPTNFDWAYVYEVETFEGFTGLIQEELDYFEFSNNLPRLGAVALDLTQIDFESNPDLKPIVQTYLKLVAQKIPEISNKLEAAIAA
jgi:hypothetical protein